MCLLLSEHANIREYVHMNACGKDTDEHGALVCTKICLCATGVCLDQHE